MRLGESRDTDDSTGRVISACEVGESVTDTVVRDAMRALTGRVPQRPPAFSAVKVDGERAYQGARRGRAPVLMPREVEVARFDLVRREGPDVWFAVEVSGGTYVRALARDVGAAIGCGAHLAALRRVSIGPFTVDDAWAPAKGGGPPPQRPPSDLVRHLPALGLDAAARDAVAHGRSIPCDTPVEGPVALFAADTLVAIAEPADAVLKPRVVLVDD
jgi:tRNA pseudouridine55 synthase